MNPPAPWLLEVLHQMALVPLVAVLLLRREGDLLFVAAGFAMSWVGDSLAGAAGGSFVPSYLWLPLQIGLVLAAFPPGEGFRGAWAVIVIWGAAVLAGVSYWLSAPGPDLLVTVVGSVTILAIATGDLRLPLYLYFGLGTVCYVLMAERVGDGWLPAWWLYQGARALAYTAFLVVILRRRGWLWARG